MKTFLECSVLVLFLGPVVAVLWGGTIMFGIIVMTEVRDFFRRSK